MPAKLWGSHYNIGRDIVVFEREGKKQLYLVDSLVDDHTYHFTPLEEKVVDGKIVENLHIVTARQTLAKADAIAALGA